MQRNLTHTGLLIIILCVLSCVVKLVVVSNDDFLHDWDERFHALVAKNMTNDPFVPMLRKTPVLEYEMSDWCCNHIWLHKPPMTMWLMALSLKLFGINVIALRLPGILLSSLLIFVNFKIGQLVHSKRLGIFLAILTCISYYHFELSIGTLRIDHVDSFLIFWTSVSTLALLHILNGDGRKWVFLAGAATGAAILTKWLVGFFPLAIYFITIILYRNTRHKVGYWNSGIMVMLLAILISAPWHLYTFASFPEEAALEWNYNFKHLTSALEHSGGSMWTYVQNFHWQYGILSWPLLALGAFSLKRSKIAVTYKLYIGVGVIFIYFFFSFVSQTRLPSYVLIATPLVLLLMALGSRFILKQTRYTSMKFAIALIIGYSLLAPHNLIKVHFLNLDTHLIKASEFINKRHNTNIYRNISKLDLADSTVIINLPDFQDVECMFWSEFICYHWWPTESEINKLFDMGFNVAAFESHGQQVLPEYIISDKRIKTLDFNLK
jgi:4-amino-4-deoxy-L-arabinose transferase-like glycosyltransferase